MVAVDINERGTIVGAAEDDERKRWVVWWSAEERALHVFGEGDPIAINDADVVAGSKLVRDALDPNLEGPVAGTVERASKPKAYLFDLRRDIEVPLPGLTGHERSSKAVDINNAGVAIGEADGIPVIFASYP